MQRLFLLSFTLILLTGNLLKGQSKTGYEIKLKIPSLKDSTIILAHYFTREGSFYPDDTVRLNKNGTGAFKGSKPLVGGMYIAYLPTHRYFDFIVGDNQFFSIEADTADLVKKIYFQGSAENKLFQDYKIFRNEKGKEMVKLDEQKKSASKEQQDSISGEIKKLQLSLTNYSKELINANPNHFFAKLLLSFQDVEVPEPPKDAKGNIIDSNFQYKYYHQHYFDNFDIANVRMLNTPFYESKILNYLDKVVPQIPDSINKELNMLMKKVSVNEDATKYLLGMLYNHCADQANKIVGMDAVFTYFAENYYLPKATWADEKFKQKLDEQIKKLKPLLIGKMAPNIQLLELPAEHFKAAATDTTLKANPTIGIPIQLNEIKAKFLVVIFWEATCGHCQKSMPLLCDSIYPKIKNLGARVLAVHAISSVEGKRQWVDFVNKYKMYDWINAWSPFSNEYRNLYDLQAFPSIYVLDANKTIIAKHIGVEQLEDVIRFEMRKE